MAEQYQRQRALDYRGLIDGPAGGLVAGQAGANAHDLAQVDGLRMWVEEACGQLCLRGAGNAAFAAAVRSVWGVALPLTPNTASSDQQGSGRRILWMGPDEWLAVCADSELDTLHDSLDAALVGQHSLVSDVSHSRVVIALHGNHARDVLAKGCSLDLDPVAFGVDQCAQTALARAHMSLHQISDAPCYHLYIHRSFAGYAYSWLEDAVREFVPSSFS